MEQKIDKRIKYMLVLDCESCPIDKTFTEVSPFNMWYYDLGFAVVDKKGKVYEAYSFVNSDIFINEKELMQSAYYADKIPKYWEDILAGRRTLTNSYNIRQKLCEVIDKYNIVEVYAHNMHFDYNCLNVTQRWLTKSKYRYFLPYGLDICDTLKMARDILGNMPTYKRFCEENGYLTKNGRLRYTAEIIFRYISKNNDFIENHTGLEDVLIEKEILAYCYKQHKKMRKLLYEN